MWMTIRSVWVQEWRWVLASALDQVLEWVYRSAWVRVQGLVVESRSVLSMRLGWWSESRRAS